MLLSRLIAAQRSLGDVVRGRFCLVDVDQVCSVGSHHLEHFPRDFQKSCVLFMILLSNRAGSSGLSLNVPISFEYLANTPRMTFRVTGTLNESPHHCASSSYVAPTAIDAKALITPTKAISCAFVSVWFP